jgi:hypothetical protein
MFSSVPLGTGKDSTHTLTMIAFLKFKTSLFSALKICNLFRDTNRLDKLRSNLEFREDRCTILGLQTAGR